MNLRFLSLFMLCSYQLLGQNQYQESSLILSLRDQKVIYEKNPNLPLNPASVTKLLTTGVSLALLGPQETFETGFFYTGSFDKGVISGDLVIQGGGDPFLVLEDLWIIVQELKALGLETIQGQVLIDQGFFEADHRTPTSGANRPYEASVSALSVNFNTVIITVAPGAKGAQGKAQFYPQFLQGFHLKNETKTALCQESKIQISNLNHKEFLIQGTLCQGSKPQRFYRPVSEPNLLAKEMFQSFLKQNRINIQNKTLEPSRQKTSLYIHKSKPLGELIQKINYFSNNVMADMLFLSLGAQIKQDGTYKGANQVIGDFYQKHLSPTSIPVLANGSGLTTEHSLPAKSVVSLLGHLYEKRKDIFPDFWASLPASGLSGSLKQRFLSQKKGIIRAKTGTLTEPVTAVSLGGYFYSEKHGLCVFATLMNGLKDKTQPSVTTLQKQQEELLSKFF